MSWGIRLILLLGSIGTFAYITIRIRKSRMKMADAIFWCFFSVVLVIMGAFPSIAIELSSFLGIQSPANFVWLLILSLSILRLFQTDQKLSRMQTQMVQLAQKYAIDSRNAENPITDKGDMLQ